MPEAEEYRERVIRRTKEISEMMADAVQKEFVEQGHNASGKTLSSIVGKVNEYSDIIEAIVEMEEHALILNEGVAKSAIPFSGVTGEGGESKYIQGLIDHWLFRGLNQEEAKSAAFATAYTQLRTGMPTPGSFFYSSNGRRKEFIEFGIESVENQIYKLLEEIHVDAITNAFYNSLDKYLSINQNIITIGL